jgi:hypothetical protein
MSGIWEALEALHRKSNEVAEFEEKKALFSFGRGAFFSGALDYKIENMHFSMRPYNAYHTLQRFEFDVTEEDLCKIGTIVAPAMKWKKEYRSVLDRLDGYEWSIEYCYNGIQIKSYGYESFPCNYKKVVNELQEYMETLCKKYAADKYKEDEAEERRSLY